MEHPYYALHSLQTKLPSPLLPLLFTCRDTIDEATNYARIGIADLLTGRRLLFGKSSEA